MSRIIMLPEELQLLIDRLDRIEEGIKERQKQPEDTFVDADEFLSLMKISRRTAQGWRDEGTIAFSQIGGKIYYKMSDVKKMLDKHYHSSRK